MKKLFSIITVISLCFISVFAYTPTVKDKALLDMVYEKVDSIDDTARLQKIAEKIDVVKAQFKYRERIYYILDSLQTYIENSVKGEEGSVEGADDSFEYDDTIAIAPTSTIAQDWDADDFTYVYEVGPGRKYAEPNDVPWENLQADSLVLIYAREEPYKNKWVINGAGTKEKPIVVAGVPINGKLPVISGNGATTREELDYWNENRSVIKVGGSSRPKNDTPSWIYIENLDIRSGHPNYSYTDDGGHNATYISNAAAVHMEYGKNIFVRNCKLHDSGNGLFTTHFTEDITIAGNQIYDNGIVGNYYSHNTYTESKGIVYEYNYFGAPKGDGNNLKDRSTGTVIRYNWIEDGNRQLDLVDTSHQEFVDDVNYHKTYVYGNILVESDDTGNSQMIHYGGDSGKTNMYRNGTIYLYYNTFVSRRSGNTTLIRLATSNAKADIKNNIIYAKSGSLAITAGQGVVTLENNWISKGWKNTFERSFNGTMDAEDNIEGTDPGFIDFDGEDFSLALASPAKERAVYLGGPEIEFQYVKVAEVEERDSGDDLGALED